jgi:hypothetical protein
MVNNFGQYIYDQYRKKGITYVIAYLKASQLALSKYIAHSPVNSLRDIDNNFIFPCLRNGLPKIIGTQDRKSIRLGNRKIIIL